jgi:tetratricopeptide (TPR) repeat protein
VADNPRIEELRRRVEKDPASIAFAQLAEEYRRAGSYEEAVATCRAGLAIHPSYLSARVTLGRSLIELHTLEEAQTELQTVLQHAPENLAAIRSLAEIHHRRGELEEALTLYRSAMGIARHDPDLEQAVAEISRAVTRAKPPVVDVMSLEQAKDEFAAFLDSFAQPAPKAEPAPETQVAPEPQPDSVPPVQQIQLVPQLEGVPRIAPEPALMAEPPLAQEAQDAPEPHVSLEPQLEIASQVLAEPRFAINPELEVGPEFVAEAEFAAGPEEAEIDLGPDLETERALQSAGNRALPGLERFLVAIHAYRQRTAV